MPGTKTGPVPVAADRKRSSKLALLFLLACSPVWIVPGMLRVGHPAVMVLIILGLTYLFLRYEGRPMAVLGLDRSGRRVAELASGLVGGAFLILTIAALAALLLPFPWKLNPTFSVSAAGIAFVGYLCGNAVEELIFRGYSFERLLTSIGHWRAQGATAILFAVFHLAQGWPWQVALLGTTVGSLLFGLVFVRWQSVPAAVGVHASVNWVRDLTLLDPPTATTLFAPFSPRPWTPSEQLMIAGVSGGVILLACLSLWLQIRHNTPAWWTATAGAQLERV